MASLTIKTNNRVRAMFPACEVPFNKKTEFRKEFDWMDDEHFNSALFFKYQGEFYALAEFSRTEADLLRKGWQGYLG